MTEENQQTKNWHDKYYKLLLIIPAVALIFSLSYMIVFYSNNNDFIYIAPDGATFIKISNAIVEFANQYKIIWVIVIALIAYSPKFTIWLYRVTDFVKDILH